MCPEHLPMAKVCAGRPTSSPHFPKKPQREWFIHFSTGQVSDQTDI